MKRSPVELIFICMMILLILLSGCGEKNSSIHKEEFKDSLYVGIYNEPVGLDPHYNFDSASELVNSNIYESLIIYDYVSEEFEPCLAESWQVSSDGLEYVFHLKKGVKFHNGENMKASDVKFSFDRLGTCPLADLVEAINKFEVVDDSTVRIEMKYPYSPFLDFLATPQFSIVSEDALKEAGDNLNSKAVGTGPYRIIEWQSGDMFLMESFQDYHGGPVPIKKLVFKLMEDSGSALMKLQNGSIDFLTFIPGTDKQGIIDNETLNYQESEALGFDFMALNCQRKPFDNIQVRQAIAHSLDLDEILHVALNGGGRVAENFISRNAFGHTENVKRYKKDTVKARNMLSDAGYPHGLDITIMTTRGLREKEAEVIQASLLESGINAEIVIYEWSTYLDMVKNGEYDLLINNWGYLAPDADEGVYTLLHSKYIGESNWARYSNSRIDELLEIGHTNSVAKVRLQAYEELTRIVHDEVPMIPLVSRFLTVAYDKRLGGVHPRPQSFHYFKDYRWE